MNKVFTKMISRVFKRNFSWTMVFLLLCASHPSTAMAAKPVKIVASFYPVFIMARNVARNVPGVTVSRLTPPATGCLHDYAVTINDLKALDDADVLVANGAGMEGFLDRVISQFPSLMVVRLADGIPLIPGSGASGGNPHVWVSVSNAIIEVRNLATFLAGVDPRNAAQYHANADGYILKLDALRRQMHTELDAFKGQKIITFHEAFPYFAREFGLVIAAVVEREPGSEPSARELAETVATIKNDRVPAIFVEPQYPSRAAAAISRETNTHVLTLDPAVNGDDNDDAYLNIMRKDLEVLKNAFSK